MLGMLRRLVFCLCAAVATAIAQKGTGSGIILGDPTGLTLKH